LSLALALDGHFDQALRVCDETLAVVKRRSPPGVRPGRRAMLGEQLVHLAELAREQILEFQRDVAQARTDSSGLRSRTADLAAAGRTSSLASRRGRRWPDSACSGGPRRVLARRTAGT